MLPDEKDFDATMMLQNSGNQIPDQAPFHILLLGDWSADNKIQDLSQRRPIQIDRDNFDEVLRDFRVTLSLDLTDDDSSLSVEINEFDDFHPDNLFRQVAVFRELRNIRRRLQNSDSFNDAARQVRAWFNISDSNENTVETEESMPFTSDNLLDQILSKPAGNFAISEKVVDNSELGIFISKIVTPHLIKIDENEQSKLISAVDEAVSSLMRTILHHPKFQALESAWRGLYLLVKQIETDHELKIFILDISQAELTDNLKSVNSLADSFLFNTLNTDYNESSQNSPFALVGGIYSFGVNVEDTAALMRIAKIANAGVIPFVSHIRPEMFGIKSFGEVEFVSESVFQKDSDEGRLWLALREIPEAKSIGLSPMRLLARLPYGKSTDSTENFSFEEFSDRHNHNEYLWTNPAFIFALLLAQNFKHYGWNKMYSHKFQPLGNLPLHTYSEHNQAKIKSPAEIFIKESFAEKLLQNGMIPLISFRDRDHVFVPRLQSAVFQDNILEGKWSSLG